MPSGYKRQHLRIDHLAELKRYKRPNRVVPTSSRGNETEQHAEALKKELASAWAASNDLLEARDGSILGTPGRYLDFETLPDAPLPNLAWSSKGIRLASATRAPSGEVEGTLFVPDASQGYLTAKLDEYKVNRGKNGDPSHAARFASIEHFRAARLESLWVDSRPIPDADKDSWWECWCWPDRIAHLETKAAAGNVLIGEGRLRFAERQVIFLHTDRATMASIVASTDAVAELRLGRDDAYFFTNSKARDDQHGWIADATSRIALAENRDAVAVCLLDTGINRAHPLLAPVLAGDDLHTINPDWGVADHHGHGSEMSGLALYGDLVTSFASTTPLSLSYVLEGVKLLPPPGFVPTQPQSYGLATRQAILRPEIAKPLRERVFCMAVTQSDVFGPKATSWSAALDMSAFGGDDLEDLRERLICVSAGNLPDGLKQDALEDWDSYEIEDPAHAWNVLTVGGYTQKGPITDHGMTHWPCAATLGSLSPYSRVSAAWARGVSPIKPELVLEAGNKGVDSADLSMVSGIDSLSLLTTSWDPLGQPLTLSWATSAATAQLSGMAAAVLADDPELWPETVRALLVHSARWTPQMDQQLLSTNQKSERLLMLRRFGYGVPDLARTLRSASNSLALVAQQELQPFIREKGKATRLNHSHFYSLPWPLQTLLDLGEHQVRLRVTLSYFVEPNPSADAPLSPARYRSAGLRFDLRRTGENQAQFEARINQLAVADDDGADIGPATDPGRLLGEKSVSAGSLHVDEWRCNAADLADRASIAIFPVGGWWKSTSDKERNNATMRYALVVTIDAGDVELDLWVEAAIAAGVEIAAEVEIDI